MVCVYLVEYGSNGQEMKKRKNQWEKEHTSEGFVE